MFEKVSKGTPFVGSTATNSRFVNSTIDCVNNFTQQQQLGYSGDSGKGLNLPTDLVKVQNKTEAARARGEVVKLGNYLFSEINFRNLWFEGNAPDEPVDQKYAILLEPLEVDKIGIAQASGVCVARVNVTSTSHCYAIPQVDEHVLISADSGPFEILSPIESTDEQDAVVRFQSPAKPVGFPFRNDDPDDAPHRGIMQIVGSEDDGDGNERLIVVKPGNSSFSVKLKQPPCFAINITGEAVAEDETGTCVLATDASAFPLPLLYAKGTNETDDPVMGQTVGPSLDANTWKVYFGEPGFEVLRFVEGNTEDDDDTNDDDLVWVRPSETTDAQFTGLSMDDSYGSSGGKELRPHSCVRAYDSFGLDETLPMLHRPDNDTYKIGIPCITDAFTRSDFDGRRRLSVDAGYAKPVIARIVSKAGGQYTNQFDDYLAGPIIANFDTYTPYSSAYNEDCLWPGLPGFRIIKMLPKDNLSDDFQYALVLRDPSPAYCLAVADWVPQTSSFPAGMSTYDTGTVKVQACREPHNSGSAKAYDGSAIDLPKIEFTVRLYGWSNRQPNVLSGKVFSYEADLNFGTVARWVSRDPIAFDDPIGTIKMWNSTTSIPSGWHICDYSGGTTIDLRGAFPVGYKSGDADFGAVGSSTVAGAKTHTHTAHGTASLGGTGTTVLTNTNNHSTEKHLPPYNVVVFIQRVAP